ncbi:uncharacterized protein LOC100889560 isoform X2 [Strongylocentrotus purpuratus]|uniref:RBR-type E3 ubiquitin transferase n=1 Tax=Strongylocentrotus purpuratus TaxID=7668 RepID=A0A7M7NDC0_STRPU|nr:uncharacterized protein LOC100889560 isoform X2 [Strongylocentrotus purpuratus]
MAASLGRKKCMTRSGKTLRYIQRQATWGNMSAFKGQYAILKVKNGLFNASHSMDFEEIVQDGGLMSNSEIGRLNRELVLYSLNKKKRWLLPAMIAEGIADREFHKDCDYQVVMVEREIPSFKNNIGSEFIECFQNTWKPSCKAVHRSNPAGSSCRRARKNCSYQEDLLSNPEAVRNRREEKAERRRERARTGKRIAIPTLGNRGAEHVPRLPELRYEVLRPTPLHHCIMQSKYRHFDEEWDKIIKRHSAGRLKNDSHIKCQLDTDLYEGIHLDFDVDEEWPIYTVPGGDDWVKHLEDSAPFDLCSFITSSQRTKPCKRNGQETFEKDVAKDKAECFTALASPTRKRYGKGCAIHRPDLATLEPETAESKSDFSYVDTMDSGFESSGSSTVEDDHRVSWLDLGSVAKEAVHPDRLRMDFGHDYVDGRSVPRRFSIKMKAVSASQVPVCASAVCAVEDAGHNPEMVNIRLRCCSGDSPVQDLHLVIREGISTPPLDILSLVDKLKEILSHHASCQEILESNVCKSRRPEVTLETVQSMMGWTFTYDTPEHVKAQLDDAEAGYEQHLNGTPDFSESEISLEGEDSCGICLESLAPSGDEGEEKGTALHGCSHLFCNACWVHHVTSRVLMGETIIHCPAFQCESMIDKTTLLSVLPDALTHIHLTRLHDNRINGHPQWKWCPNPKCGRLVQVKEKDQSKTGSKTGLESGPEASERLLGVPVPCECGVMWCSECQKAAHWPATCKEAEQHIQHIKDTGVDNEKSERITSVKVKRCPSCRNPMEKKGGCNSMYCICGFNFCWECLAAWQDHDLSLWNFKCPQKQENLEFFVPETASQLPDDDLLPQSTWDHQDTIPWSYSFSQTDQSRLTTLVATATKMAAFAAEVRMLLEYVSILIGLMPRKQRMKKGWKIMILRLMFIANRMEELLESHHGKSAGFVWRSLMALLHQGQLCLRDITRTVPLLHKGLENVKGQG